MKLILLIFVFLAPLSAYTFMVRVLLDEQTTTPSHCLWSIESKEGCILSDLHDASRQKKLSATTLKIGIHENSKITFNGKKTIIDNIKISFKNGCFTYNHQLYKGSLLIIKDNNSLYLINYLELEEYVESGLRWEMIPSWPSAALEAGAIAYRTYVSALVRANRQKLHTLQKPCLYDIRCTAIHQVYKGYCHHTAVWQAVQKTKGIIITYNKEPITALYDACCGGIVTSHREGFDFNKAPYLARSYPCLYCKDSPLYSWDFSCSVHELSHKLSSILPGKKITDIKISSVDKAGVVQKVMVKADKKWIVLPVNKLLASVKSLKSGMFSIVRQRHMVRFKGKGFGHQVGFCQYGSRTLAKKMGWDYRKIIKFYYPNTTLSKLGKLNLCLDTKVT